MPQLNGWQRIGMVLSALWCLFAVAYAVQGYLAHSQWTEQNAQMEATISECRANAKKQAGPDKRAGLERACGLSDAEVGLASSRPALPAVLAFIFLPVVGAWLAAYVVVWMTKWIAAGFGPR